MGVGADAEGERRQLSERLKAIVSKKRLPAGPHHRRRHPRRPHAVDRPARHHRRDAARYEGDKLVLTIPKAHAALDGERLRRRFAALADLLEREPEVRVGQ